MVRARAVLDLAAALDDAARRHAAAPRCSAGRRAAADRRAGRMEQTGIAVDVDLLTELEERLRRPRCATPQRTPTTPWSATRSTSARPSSSRWSCSTSSGMPKTKRTKTGYTTDADALQRPLRQDRAPVPGAPAAPPRRDPAAGRRSRACSSRSADDGRIHTTYQPDRSRPPAGCPPPTPTCRTSRSAPRRGAGSARSSSSGDGLESLMTADYCQIEMRIMAHLSERRGSDRGVPLRRGPAPVPSAPGSSASTPDDVTPAMRVQDQGDVLRPGLRPLGVRAVPAAAPSTPARPAGLMDEYFERFGGVRDYLAARRRRGAAHRLHRDHPRAGGATCPT